MPKTKSNRSKNKKLSPSALRAVAIKTYKSNPRKRFSAKQIIKKNRIKNTKDSVQSILEQLEQKRIIRHVKEGKYKWISEKSNEQSPIDQPSKVISGKVDITRIGSAYIVSDELDTDVFIAKKHINSALHGDTVTVQLFDNKNTRRRPEGKVIKVTDRAHSRFAGLFKQFPNFGIVYVNHPKMTLEVKVFPEQTNDAKDGDYVVVDVERYNQSSRNSAIIGKVAQVMDASDRNEIEMITILTNNGFEIEFSDKVMREATGISEEITEDEVNRRRDMRTTLCFTIDPRDAKDFDDAISYQKLENGDIEIGVHIADVTHYVQADTALDREAFKRSTSVYLADRVCPMLPERLSNELCSLRPNEDKLCFSTVFTFDESHNITSEWIGKTLIHSDRRFTYDDAQALIEQSEGEWGEVIQDCHQIAQTLRKQRFKNGSINFASEEVRFELDENNVPVGVYKKVSKEANKLIEDFMLLANRTVARYIAKKSAKEIPFVYRIHDEPNPEKLADFGLFAASLGVNLKLDTPENISRSFEKLHRASADNEELKLLEPLAIRTMAKAVYSTENIGHYGLSFEYYSHFTSPIRRYSDVLAHRILFKNLQNDIYRANKIELEGKCLHVSVQERKATDAERASIKYKQAEYMLPLIGQTFEGQISGIIDMGIFVELKESKAEGMVRFDRLREPYHATSNRLIWESAKTGGQIKMGDTVMVKLLDVNMEKKEIEFDLVNK